MILAVALLYANVRRAAEHNKHSSSPGQRARTIHRSRDITFKNNAAVSLRVCPSASAIADTAVSSVCRQALQIGTYRRSNVGGALGLLRCVSCAISKFREAPGYYRGVLYRFLPPVVVPHPRSLFAGYQRWRLRVTDIETVILAFHLSARLYPRGIPHIYHSTFGRFEFAACWQTHSLIPRMLGVDCRHGQLLLCTLHTTPWASIVLIFLAASSPPGHHAHGIYVYRIRLGAVHRL
ncbi:hypothetical protein C8Q79DRAFT_708315 [Trametes meyenii]|nr:hypothetical protein C8Q79DRAFT_708315 [Trametes meyenii]